MHHLCSGRQITPTSGSQAAHLHAGDNIVSLLGWKGPLESAKTCPEGRQRLSGPEEQDIYESFAP